MRRVDLTDIVWRKSSRSLGQGECVEVGWRKPSRSNQQGGACVEVVVAQTRTAVRDSKNPDGPTFTVPATAWTTFLATLA